MCVRLFAYDFISHQRANHIKIDNTKLMYKNDDGWLLAGDISCATSPMNALRLSRVHCNFPIFFLFSSLRCQLFDMYGHLRN